MQVSTVHQRMNGVFYAVVVRQDGSRSYISTGSKNKEEALRRLPNLMFLRSVEKETRKPE